MRRWSTMKYYRVPGSIFTVVKRLCAWGYFKYLRDVLACFRFFLHLYISYNTSICGSIKFCDGRHKGSKATGTEKRAACRVVLYSPPLCHPVMGHLARLPLVLLGTVNHHGCKMSHMLRLDYSCVFLSSTRLGPRSMSP